MIDKTQIRDHAFVAMLQHNGYACERNPDGSYTVRASDAEFAGLYRKFRLEFQPVLLRLRRLRPKPDLHHSTRHASSAPQGGNLVVPCPQGTLTN